MKTGEIAALVSGELIGKNDVEVRGIAAVNDAGEGDIVFIDDAAKFGSTSASCLLIPKNAEISGDFAVIRVANPKAAFARVAEKLLPKKDVAPGVHPTAIIAKNATVNGAFIGAYVCIGDLANIGEGSQIRHGAKIGDGVTIGRDCVIHANVVIQDGCTIGDRVILHPGVVIGADGFGFVRENQRYIKFPQVGHIVIEDDIEIGANTCVDRAALGETRIGSGTKIDNLVQIAHNVTIGKRVVIAAQTGISGSTVIEDDCVIGGQVGFGDHARVRAGAVIGSQAGVLPGKIVRPGVWWGTPVQPLDEYKRMNANLKGIERLKAEVKELKRRLDEFVGRT